MKHHQDSRTDSERQVDTTFRAIVSSHDYEHVVQLAARLEQWLQNGGTTDADKLVESLEHWLKAGGPLPFRPVSQ